MSKTMLQIENLTVTIFGREVLTDVNLSINKGQCMALMGPNGSGKTSLLMAVMGFPEYRITRGSIFFNGKKLNNLSIDQRARLGLGIMFQRPPAIRGVKLYQVVDVIKNKTFNISRESEQLNLKPFLNRDINSGFSGGELKRSELIQLLACPPRLTFFDEPESGVDLENINLVGRVINQILEQRRDNAGLIITHTGYIFDYVEPDQGCILVGGRIHCIGDAREILKTIKKHGYQGCVTCEGQRLKKRSLQGRK